MLKGRRSDARDLWGRLSFELEEREEVPLDRHHHHRWRRRWLSHRAGTEPLPGQDPARGEGQRCRERHHQGQQRHRPRRVRLQAGNPEGEVQRGRQRHVRPHLRRTQRPLQAQWLPGGRLLGRGTPGAPQPGEEGQAERGPGPRAAQRRRGAPARAPPLQDHRGSPLRPHRRHRRPLGPGHRGGRERHGQRHGAAGRHGSDRHRADRRRLPAADRQGRDHRDPRGDQLRRPLLRPHPRHGLRALLQDHPPPRGILRAGQERGQSREPHDLPVPHPEREGHPDLPVGPRQPDRGAQRGAGGERRAGARPPPRA